MQKRQQLWALFAIMALLASPAFAQEPNQRGRNGAGSGPANGSGTIAPQVSTPLVNGTGTIGRIPRWTAFSGYNYTLGDSAISESSAGDVGIGTAPTGARLTVGGVIQATGGFKFGDGTLQTTSAAGALSTVAHDATLMGDGTAASPLGVASPLMVRDLDNPARQPVQASITCHMGNPMVACGQTVIYVVPQGKRLVIEYASMNATIPEGQSATMSIQTTDFFGG